MAVVIYGFAGVFTFLRKKIQKSVGHRVKRWPKRQIQ
jgi:hypothetical protein